MENYLLDFANLLLRWLHVITAIAWIGASFYFVWLDNSLVPPQDPSRGIDGELWAVHGGGFYNPQKTMLPKALPTGRLHWFYWEAYATWLSGFALFIVLYLWQPSTFLIDPRVHAWSHPGWAIAAALGFLFVGWIVYDLVCHVFGKDREGRIGKDLRVGVLVFVFVAFASWLACQLFAGRAAFLIVGAMLGTMMSANVGHWIIPGQRKLVAALKEGRTPDAVYGLRGRQRSVHNTYFTLPVLVAMISNHYGLLTNHRWNWVLLLALMLAGALIRQFFVLRHKQQQRWGLVAAALVLLGAVFALAMPARAPTAAAGSASFDQVQAIVAQRCAACHNAALAQKGVRLDSAEAIRQHAAQIQQQAVVTHTMPLNNATGMTDDERALLGRWFEAIARGR